MTPYTPTEILPAGGDDVRGDAVGLYIELDRLRAAIAGNWHRVNVDEHVPLLDGEERVAVHTAAPEFRGTDVAVPVSRVHIDRLTAAGCRLYELARTIIDTRAVLDVARTASTAAQRRALVTAALHATEAAKHRAKPYDPTPIVAAGWPVRVPGAPSSPPPGTAAARAARIARPGPQRSAGRPLPPRHVRSGV